MYCSICDVLKQAEKNSQLVLNKIKKLSTKLTVWNIRTNLFNWYLYQQVPRELGIYSLTEGMLDLVLVLESAPPVDSLVLLGGLQCSHGQRL